MVVMFVLFTLIPVIVISYIITMEIYILVFFCFSCTCFNSNNQTDVVVDRQNTSKNQSEAVPLVEELRSSIVPKGVMLSEREYRKQVKLLKKYENMTLEKQKNKLINEEQHHQQIRIQKFYLEEILRKKKEINENQ